jgi:hypothetical protein
VTQIDEPRALKCQLLPVAEWVDSPKDELFSIVSCLKPAPTKINHPFYQRLQARHHLKIVSLILDQWWKKMLVRPLGHIVQVDMKPPSGGTFQVAPKRNVQVFLPMVAA